MSENRILLDAAAFLDSAHAIRVDSASTSDIREIVQRYLTACYEDLGKAPRLLEGDDVETLITELLPRHYGAKDPLAAGTEDVLSAYLGFLDETQVVTHAYEQRKGLAGAIDAFVAVVASGEAHRDGVAVTGRPKTVRHAADKTGRNDPCPCGSGKKFKKCCMNLGR